MIEREEEVNKRKKSVRFVQLIDSNLKGCCCKRRTHAHIHTHTDINER